MALVFDRFGTINQAAEFVTAVKALGRDAVIHTDANAAADAAFYPFGLEGAAVVLVDREAKDDESEEAVIALVRGYGGSFAGT